MIIEDLEIIIRVLTIVTKRVTTTAIVTTATIIAAIIVTATVVVKKYHIIRIIGNVNRISVFNNMTRLLQKKNQRTMFHESTLRR
jgi:hypothetical protein